MNGATQGLNSNIKCPLGQYEGQHNERPLKSDVKRLKKIDKEVWEEGARNGKVSQTKEHRKMFESLEMGSWYQNNGQTNYS